MSMLLLSLSLLLAYAERARAPDAGAIDARVKAMRGAPI
jgi:hypothetical protein